MIYYKEYKSDGSQHVTFNLETRIEFIDKYLGFMVLSILFFFESLRGNKLSEIQYFPFKKKPWFWIIRKIYSTNKHKGMFYHRADKK